MDWLIDHLAVIMFVVLTFVMFLGYPVAFVLGAIGIIFGLFGTLIGVFSYNQFANLLPRIYGQAVRESGARRDPDVHLHGHDARATAASPRSLLKILQVLLRRMPGGLALAVTCSARSWRRPPASSAPRWSC